jgi:DNA mismatch repair protein MutS
MNVQKNTPLMQQYFDIRNQYSDALLFFQVGDFYELFFDDAKKASSFLAIALTKRGKCNGQDVPLCGIPIHALDHYLCKLVKGGFKVAICDQLEKPKPGTVVKRGVTQVLTPGTLTDSKLLDEKSASYIFAFYPNQTGWGLVFSELLTAQLFATNILPDSYRVIESELARFLPDEIILPAGDQTKKFDSYFKKLGYCTSQSDLAGEAVSKAWIEKQFNKTTAKAIENCHALFCTMEVLYFYLKKTQEKALNQFKSIQFYQPNDYLILDPASQKNLELIKNNHDGGRRNSLFAIVDKSKTAMGSRTIKKWLLRPLINKEAIVQRQEVVEAIFKQINLMQQLDEILVQISDLERIIGRIALQRAPLQDYIALKYSLKLMPNLQNLIASIEKPLARMIFNKIGSFESLVQLIECGLNENSSSGFIIKKGFDQNLDRLRCLVENSQLEVLKLEKKESQRTGINSLKIRYNQVSGYYIEVTNPNLSSVPEDYIHQQTLANRKRFVTQELKNLERDIFKAQNEIDIVQDEVFQRIKDEVESDLTNLRNTAYAVAYLDGLYGFASVAYNNSYVAPLFCDRQEILISGGRHPVIEENITGTFVKNDCTLSQKQLLKIITGPNMGGKSTYLRQVALICIMAQCGSFVPADSAVLPILDRVFTRIGASDNLAEGKSTFLVEMEEVATICAQATNKSLVILDEVGRGTSTAEGIAIAQSIIEHIVEKIKALSLFATHYHELTFLDSKFSCIKNYSVQCHKEGATLHFLHKISPGIATHSFGIDVARLAQLPEAVVARAIQVLNSIDNSTGKSSASMRQNNNSIQSQTSFFPATINHNHVKIVQLEKTISELKKQLELKQLTFEKLEELDVNNLSPKQAFDILWDMKTKDVL